LEGILAYGLKVRRTVKVPFCSSHSAIAGLTLPNALREYALVGEIHSVTRSNQHLFASVLPPAVRLETWYTVSPLS
jgi:hypothetical protein